jgi:hypothetical protein
MYILYTCAYLAHNSVDTVLWTYKCLAWHFLIFCLNDKKMRVLWSNQLHCSDFFEHAQLGLAYCECFILFNLIIGTLKKSHWFRIFLLSQTSKNNYWNVTSFMIKKRKKLKIKKIFFKSCFKNFLMSSVYEFCDKGLSCEIIVKTLSCLSDSYFNFQVLHWYYRKVALFFVSSVTPVQMFLEITQCPFPSAP